MVLGFPPIPPDMGRTTTSFVVTGMLRRLLPPSFLTLPIPLCDGTTTISRTPKLGHDVPNLFLLTSTAIATDAEQIAAHEAPPPFSALYWWTIPGRVPRSTILCSGGR